MGPGLGAQLYPLHCSRLCGNTVAVGEESEVTCGHDGHSGIQGSICLLFLVGRDNPVLGPLGCGKDRLPSGGSPRPRSFPSASVQPMPHVCSRPAPCVLSAT